jgi:lipopolysaccharide transport system permease protein
MEELIIEADRAERHYWHDLWRYRELFRVLAWRDVAVRYKQTVIGAAWALFTMVVFTVVVFGKLAKLPSEGETKGSQNWPWNQQGQPTAAVGTISLGK